MDLVQIAIPVKTLSLKFKSYGSGLFHIPNIMGSVQG